MLFTAPWLRDLKALNGYLTIFGMAIWFRCLTFTGASIYVLSFLNEKDCYFG